MSTPSERREDRRYQEKVHRKAREWSIVVPASAAWPATRPWYERRDEAESKETDSGI